MNFLRRLFHRPNARRLSKVYRERLKAVTALQNAIANRDRRGEGERTPAAQRATLAALKMELGK